MGTSDRKITRVVTDEGVMLYRRVTEVLMPNGKWRYPVDYFDATPGVVKVTKDESWLFLFMTKLFDLWIQCERGIHSCFK